MFLSDHDIKAAVKKKTIRIDEFDESRLQPASYDILLGNDFIMTVAEKSPLIDPSENIFPQTREEHVEDRGSFVLHPGVSVLGISRDFFGSDHYLIHLSGKSSLARLGLLVHNTAGIINPGHYLNITLELCNLNRVPIVLRPGMPIAQILFSPLSRTPDLSYRLVGRYCENNWEHHVPAKNRKEV